MNYALEFLKNMGNPENLTMLLKEWGWIAYIVLTIVVFSETGLLVGFFLPGDSLLFVTGFVCSPALGSAINYFYIVPLLMAAAVIGDTTNYWIGRRTGPMIFNKEDSLLFHKKHLVRTQKFYDKYGGRTLIYARFVPIVRTFAPFVAGMGKMPYLRFLKFSVVGGIGWILSISFLGYRLGKFSIIQRNLEKAVLLVILISFLPIVIEWFRHRREKQAEAAAAVGSTVTPESE